jgi:multisubunit Na+/H+ antiporter MnhB subunit
MSDEPSAGFQFCLILMLLISLAGMPEDYDFGLRIFCIMIFGWLALRAWLRQMRRWIPVWVTLMVVFNPFWVPELRQPLWTLLTLVAVVVLAVALVLEIALALGHKPKRKPDPRNVLPVNLEAVRAKRKAARAGKTRTTK